MSEKTEQQQLDDVAYRLFRDFPSALLQDVFVERARQDAQWGGAAHDDTHTMGDWLNFINKQAGLTQTSAVRDEAEMRGRVVKIAALALAALASYERKNPAAACDCPGCRLEALLHKAGIDASVSVLSPTPGLDLIEALMRASLRRTPGEGGGVH